jgi:hypothetical protein
VSFKRSPELSRKIEQYGQTYGLPLFEDKPEYLPPAWIYDGNGIKAAVYENMKNRLPARRLEVLKAFIKLGKATDQEVAHYLSIEINMVTGRRDELQKAGIIVSYGETKIGKYNQPNTVYYVNFKKLKEYLGL